MKFKAKIIILILSPLLLLGSCKEKTVNSSSLESGRVLRYYHVIRTGDDAGYVTATFLARAELDLYKKPYGTETLFKILQATL